MFTIQENNQVKNRKIQEHEKKKKHWMVVAFSTPMYCRLKSNSNVDSLSFITREKIHLNTRSIQIS